MKYYKRLGIYKASNVTFDPKTLEAHSYRWWKFVAVVEGKVIFNNYRYSVSTSKHQRKVRQLLFELGIKIDISMPLPKGINSSSLEDLILIAEEYLCDEYLYKTIRAQERYQEKKEAAKRKQLADLDLTSIKDTAVGQAIASF